MILATPAYRGGGYLLPSYMYSGDSVTVKFIADTDLMDELIDLGGRINDIFTHAD